MERKLENLTKEHWDTLFPIELVNHNLDWKHIYEEEKQKIEEKIGAKIIQIEHVGSTSIPNIRAKSYIDISIEIPNKDLFNEDIIEALESLNYHFFRQAGTDADYMVFVKGYNLNGEKEQIYHVHMCPPEHEMLNQITFRDFLISHPQRAQEYEQLKLELALKFRNDRSGYRIAKGEFIAETMNMAREQNAQ